MSYREELADCAPTNHPTKNVTSANQPKKYTPTGKPMSNHNHLSSGLTFLTYPANPAKINSAKCPTSSMDSSMGQGWEPNNPSPLEARKCLKSEFRNNKNSYALEARTIR